MTFTFKSAKLFFDQASLDLVPNKTSSSEVLYVDFNSTKDQNHQRFQIFIHPKKEVTLKKFELRFSVPLSPNTTVHSNGFLPNHRSGTYQLSDKLSGRGWLSTKTPLYQQAPIFQNKKSFYSFHYAFAGNESKGLFLGSLNETTAFTSFEYDAQNQEIIIRKDITDLQLGHSFPLLDLLVCTGKKEASFENYFSAMESNLFAAPPISGWMANKIRNGNSAAAIRNFLAHQKEEDIPVDLVLIGAGYAKEVGDWLFSSDQFPDGLPEIIAEIKAAGLQVGMSVSPLLCSPTSDVYRQHPAWVLKDEKNNSVTIKTESGLYYVLDAYDPGVQDYLQVFCYTVTVQWGIDLLKFDHLSTAFATARKTKTRAQAINDFLKMLRSSCTNTLIWATDLPIATGWLYANYTSVASDLLESWGTRFPLLYADPNAATAVIQLKNQLQRNPFVRYGTAASLTTLVPSQKWTEAQRYTALFINALFSDITVVIDPPEQLSTELWGEWKNVEQWKSAEITNVNFQTEDLAIIDFKNRGGKKFRGLVNLSNKENSVDGINLGAGETLVLGNEQ